MNQKERMLAELPYKSWLDGLPEERLQARLKVYAFNQCRPDEFKQSQALLREILGSVGEHVFIEAPFRCDYGKHIHIGDNFYANYNLIILDVAQVNIGDGVMCGPNVTICTAGHPVHPQSRAAGYEYGIAITIGSNVWIGGNVFINPGVQIGENTVIGAGSVVTKDLPANVIAVGNPCRPLSEISAADRKFYFKDRPFDVEDY